MRVAIAAVAATTAITTTTATASGGPRFDVLGGFAVPLDDQNEQRDALPDIAWKALWTEQFGAVGLAAHYSTVFPHGSDDLTHHRLRLGVEGQAVLEDRAGLAWLLTLQVGVQLASPELTDAGWETHATGAVGVCMAFTGWSHPPLVCLPLRLVIVETADWELVPQAGIRF